MSELEQNRENVDESPSGTAENEAFSDAELAPTLPLHRRLWRTKAVSYVRGVIAAIFSMLIIGSMVGLYLVDARILRVNVLLDDIRADVQDALEFVFPEYYVSLGDLRLSPDVSTDGWFVVDDVTLNDPVNQRFVDISEIRLSPSIINMIIGRGRFHHIVVEQAIIDYRFEAPEQNQPIGFPISLLDIPSSILTKYGDIEISDMILRLVSAQNDELFSVRDLQGSLHNDAKGYQARVGARQAETQEGSFVFNVTRDDEALIANGFARNYRLDAENNVSVDFDMNLDFEGVPEFDFTSIEENISKPYQYLEDGKGLLRFKSANVQAEAHYEYDDAKDVLSIQDMKLALGEQNFEGQVEVKLGDAIIARGFDFAAHYEGRNGDVNFEGGSFLARVNLAEQVLDLGEVSFLNDYFHFYGTGQAKLQPNPQVQFDGKLAKIERDDIEALWPASLGDAAFEMFSNRFKFSTLEDIGVWVRYNNDLKLEIAALGDDVNISAVDFIPSIVAEKAQIRVTENDLLVTTPKADFAQFEDEMEFEKVLFWVPSFQEKPLRGVVDFSAMGQLGALLASLNKPPLLVADRARINPQTTQGNFVVEINLDVPFKSGLTFQQMGFQADGFMNDLKLKNYLQGRDVSSPKATLKMTQDRLDISGPVEMSGLAGNAVYAQNLSPGSASKIAINTVVTPAFLKANNVTLPPQLELGRIPIDADIEVINGGVDFAVNANLRDMGFFIAGLDRMKSRGTAGQLVTDGRYEAGKIKLNDFVVSAEGLYAKGDVESNGQINLDRLKLKSVFDGEGVVKGTDVLLRNSKVDLRQFDFATAQPNPNPYNVKLENVDVVFQQGYTFTNLFGALRTGTDTSGDVTGKLGGIAPTRAQLWQENGLYNAKVVTDDMGGAFRGLGLFGDIYGGDLVVKAKATGYPGVFAASIEGSNFEVNNSTTAIKLLQAASIFGGLEGNQLSFESLNADVVIQPGRIGVYSGYLYGPSIGITLGGAYFNQTKRADFFGVVTPAYLLNGAFQKIPGFGQLLGGNVGEGLFGVTYRILGTSPDLNIQANPLSLLTPGITRNIWGNVPQTQTLKPEFRIE